MTGKDIIRVPPNPRMVEVTVRYTCGCTASESRRAGTGHSLPNYCKQHPHCKIKSTLVQDINRGPHE